MQLPPRQHRILAGALALLALVSIAVLTLQGRAATAQRGPVDSLPTATPTPTASPTLGASSCPRGQSCVTVTATATGTATSTSTATSTATATVTATATGTVPPQIGATLTPGQTAAAAQDIVVAPDAVTYTPFLDIRACGKVTVFAASASQPGTPPSGVVDILSSPDGLRDYGLLATIALVASGGGVSPSGFGYTQSFTGIMSSFTNNQVSGVSTAVTLAPATPRLRFRLSNPGAATMALTVMVYCTV